MLLTTMYDEHFELQHILLEIKAERWHAIERFLFPYYCYRHRLVSRQGKPDWNLAREQLPHSSKVTRSKQSVIEPLVPEPSVVGLLKGFWKDNENITLEQLECLLATWLEYVVISKEELKALKQAGLEKSMPSEWYQTDQPTIGARFDKVGIKISR